MTETAAKRRRVEGPEKKEHPQNVAEKEESSNSEEKEMKRTINGEDTITTAAAATPTTPPPSNTAARLSGAPPSPSTCTIYIGGLHPRVAQVHLEKLLQPYGTIRRLQLCVPKHQTASSSSNHHYAFCEYASIEQAQVAMNTLHGRTLLGKTLTVQPAKERSSQGGLLKRPATTSEKAIESRIQAVKRKLLEKQQASARS
jgi:RNA recognition motif-containing protein